MPERKELNVQHDDSSTWNVDAFMEPQTVAVQRSDDLDDLDRSAGRSAMFHNELPV